MPYIASTLSTDVQYTGYAPRDDVGGGANVPEMKVVIQGGAGVASRHSALIDGILTPEGKITSVSDEQLDFLRSNAVFQLHEKNGYIKILKNKAAPAKVAKDMSSRDESAPFTEDDYKEGGRARKGASSEITAPKLNDSKGKK